MAKCNCRSFFVYFRRKKRVARKAVGIIAHIAAKPETAIHFAQIKPLGKSVIPFERL